MSGLGTLILGICGIGGKAGRAGRGAGGVAGPAGFDETGRGALGAGNWIGDGIPRTSGSLGNASGVITSSITVPHGPSITRPITRPTRPPAIRSSTDHELGVSCTSWPAGSTSPSTVMPGFQFGSGPGSWS
jgi:hypothetical protein